MTEKNELGLRCQAAVVSAKARGVQQELTDLEALLRATQVVISRPQAILEQISHADNVVYATYYQLAESGLVVPIDDPWDRPRQVADITLFTNYHQNIRFGALSSDGSGLPNYGEFFLELREDFIAHRTSVLEENAVTFLDKQGFHPFDPKTQTPRGFRAPWETRHEVGISKLARHLRPGMTSAEIAALVLKPGPDSSQDEFIEAHIFGPMTRRTLRRVTLAPSAGKGRKNARKDVILKGLSKRLKSINVEIRGF